MPQPTICLGGHYYHIDTMQETLLGFIHGMMMDGTPAMAQRKQTIGMEFLHRMITYCHSETVCKRKHPKLGPSTSIYTPRCLRDLLNILSLCVLVILGNALSPRTYMPATDTFGIDQRKFGVNSIPAIERKKYSYMRGLAREVIAWVIEVHRATNVEDGSPVDIGFDILVPFYGTLLRGIAQYHVVVANYDGVGMLDCSLRDLLDQILSAFHSDFKILEWLDSNSADTFTTSSLLHPFSFEIHISEAQHTPGWTGMLSISDSDKKCLTRVWLAFSLSGDSYFDELYFQALDLNWDDDQSLYQFTSCPLFFAVAWLESEQDTETQSEKMTDEARPIKRMRTLGSDEGNFLDTNVDTTEAE